MEVTVNGVKYSQNETKQSKVNRKGYLNAMMAIALASYSMGNNYSRKRPVVDLVSEYELIQNKQSNLSKNDRDWVVRTFEANYTKV